MNENNVTLPKIVPFDTSLLRRRKAGTREVTQARIDVLRKTNSKNPAWFNSRKDAMPYMLLPRQFEGIELAWGENPDGKEGMAFAVYATKTIPAKLTRKVAAPAKAK